MANGEDTRHHPSRRVDPMTRAGMALVDAILGRSDGMKLEKLPRSERRKNAAEQQASDLAPTKSATPAPYPQPKRLEMEAMPDLSGKTPLDRNKYA